jgi:hypothetical protein
MRFDAANFVSKPKAGSAVRDKLNPLRGPPDYLLPEAVRTWRFAG